MSDAEQRFIENCKRAMRDLALHYAGLPPDWVRDSLQRWQAEARKQVLEVAPYFSEEQAERLARGMANTIVEMKNEIERGGFASKAKN
jgi:hypothetical protein